MATELSSSERARLEVALAAVCRQAGVDPTGAQLMRYTMNAVYLLPAAGVVVRMSTGRQAQARVSRVAQVATAFTALGLPTVRLATGHQRPIHANGWWATAWEYLPQPPGHRFAPVALAEPLRAIHTAGDLGVDLPEWDQIGKARDRLSLVDALDEAAARELRQWATALVGITIEEILSLLRHRADVLGAALKTIKWTLPPSVIHGDAHAGNLLLDHDGAVVICDLDSVALGPPEWDLVPAAHGALRFGDDPTYYRALATAYGLDITTCPAWETLRQIRELQLLTSVIANLPGRPEVARELAHRLRTGLAEDQTRIWHRYR